MKVKDNLLFFAFIAPREEKNYIMSFENKHGEVSMSKNNAGNPLTVKCPNCKQTVEPDFNETTRRFVCPICNEHVDVQVLIEKKKRGIK